MNRTITERLSQAAHWIRDVFDAATNDEILKTCSFAQFLAGGAEVVNGLRIEPDAYSVAKVLLDAVLTRSDTVNLAASMVIWQDLSSTVSVPKGQRFTPTQVGFEVIGDSSYYLTYAGYPPAIEIGELILSERTPSRRYQKLGLVTHPRTAITLAELHDLAKKSLAAKAQRA